MQEVEDAVRDVDGVQEVHELHIWQLSESKVIASLHVYATHGSDFMKVAAEIRRRLHDRGIHSVTIQPEYHPNRQPETGRVCYFCFLSVPVIVLNGL